MTLALVRGPYDPRDAEEAVLGAVLLDGGAETLPACRAAGLTARMFTTRGRQLLYRAAERIAERGAAVDPVALLAFLAEHGAAADAGGAEYLSHLLGAVPTAANVAYHARLVVDAHRAPLERQASAEQEAQLAEADRFLEFGAGDFLRWPWPTLDRVLGGMAPGKVHWMAAMTGAGKTSLAMSATKCWMTAGHRVYVAGLELEPFELRTQLACRVLGLDHGELFKGNLQQHPHWAEIRERLRTELRAQKTDPFYQHVRLAPFPLLTSTVAATLCERAADWGAAVLVIDHADHLDAEARGGHERAESLAIVKTLNALAKALKLRVFVTSQVNREGRANNKLRDHYPLTAEMVRHGDHKMHTATTFFGARRPLRADATKEQRAQAQASYTAVREILEPRAMGINVLKDRNGNALAEDLRLGFWRGEVYDTPAAAETAMRAAHYLGAA